MLILQGVFIFDSFYTDVNLADIFQRFEEFLIFILLSKFNFSLYTFTLIFEVYHLFTAVNLVTLPSIVSHAAIFWRSFILCVNANIKSQLLKIVIIINEKRIVLANTVMFGGLRQNLR